jgi:hypothetical protein
LFYRSKNTSYVFAQTGSISALIIDNTGAALLGVNIIVKKTIKGAVKYFDGKYSISSIDNESE